MSGSHDAPGALERPALGTMAHDQKVSYSRMAAETSLNSLDTSSPAKKPASRFTTAASTAAFTPSTAVAEALAT
eukprot:6913767-Pyramimonas_sp.AAC.1